MDRSEREYDIALEALRDLDEGEPGACWTPLFPSTIMAFGFPVPKTPGALGLQIPVAAMLELAEILYDVNLEDDDGNDAGVYFDGIFWRLYPTAYFEETNTVQWHLLRKPTGEEPSQALAPDHHGGPDWLRTISLETLESATAVLGYCSEVVIQLGTKSRLSQYRRYRSSKARIERPRPEASISGASFAASLLGRASATISATFKPRKGLKDARK